VCALTGAGISAESGVPTFRGEGGLWRNFRAEDLATPEAFERDPALSWKWYNWRRTRIAEVAPNTGHRALAEWERQGHALTVVTQNVDGLHERAGSRNILQLHGDLWTLRCTACAREWVDRTAPLPDLPPRCSCGAIARPGVVWFGEALPQDVWQEAERAIADCDVCLVIGTSAVVYPAAGLAHLARRKGAKVIEINIAETALSPSVDLAWKAPSAVALPQLLA
jgi:NAD-dependent deacetylase